MPWKYEITFGATSAPHLTSGCVSCGPRSIFKLPVLCCVSQVLAIATAAVAPPISSPTHYMRTDIQRAEKYARGQNHRIWYAVLNCWRVNLSWP